MDYATFKLIRMEEMSEDVRTFTFEGEVPPYRPGNFFLIRLPNDEGKKIFRSFSAAAHPSEGNLHFCVKKSGVFSSLLWKIREGDAAEISGPYGLFVLDEKDSERVFIGGGTGVAPLRSMIIQTLLEGKSTSLFHSARMISGLTYSGEMRQLEAKNPHFKFFPAVTREQMPPDWDGMRERLSAATIAQKLGALEGKTFYICGPKGMVATLVEGLMAAGVPKEKVKKEEWG